MTYISMKPGTLLSPVPAVMVSCASENDRPNIVTVAWAGTVCSQPPMVSISLKPERFSHHIIRESGEFVINLVGEDQLKAMDYCGVRSGRDEDKFASCGLIPLPVGAMDFAPAIDGCPLYLACKTQQVLSPGCHDMFIGRITDVGVREDLVGPEGGIDLKKARLIAYSHGLYQRLGDVLGFFGYSVAAPDVLERRMKELKR